MLIPKFYHSKKYEGIKYTTRAVGFWRRVPFRLFPYLTGDVIQVHIKIKRVGEEWWQQGNLRIDPPVLFDKPILGKIIASSDFHFEVEEVEKEKMWSRTLPLKGGMDFRKPCHIMCYLDLKRKENDKTTIDTIRIANIEVVRRWSFISWSIIVVLAIIIPIILYCLG